MIKADKVKIGQVDGVDKVRQLKYFVVDVENNNIDVTYKSFWETSSGMKLEEKNNERYFVEGEDFLVWADKIVKVQDEEGLWVELTLKDLFLSQINTKLKNL